MKSNPATLANPTNAIKCLMLALAACLGWNIGLTQAHANQIHFGIFNHESNLQTELARRDEDNLAFIVVNGLKNKKDPCDEAIYQQRKAWFNASEQSIIVSLAASDWQNCSVNNTNNPITHIRELMFNGDFSLGASKLPVMRLAANPKFGQYVENTRWEIGNILFATVNLPANNNHYLAEAGRNGEFEDRLVANRIWLQRLFALARQKKVHALVLFSDGNLWRPQTKVRRDGFNEVRAQITQLASKMHGKLLLIDNQSERRNNAIQWTGNIGHISMGPGWHEIHVNPASQNRSPLFSIQTERP